MLRDPQLRKDYDLELAGETYPLLCLIEPWKTSFPEAKTYAE